MKLDRMHVYLQKKLLFEVNSDTLNALWTINLEKKINRDSGTFLNSSDTFLMILYNLSSSFLKNLKSFACPENLLILSTK